MPEYENVYNEVLKPYFTSSLSLNFSVEEGYYLKVVKPIISPEAVYNHTLHPICSICNNF